MYLAAFLSCLYRVKLVGPRKTRIAGYDAILWLLHNFASTLQSMLMHVMSLFLRTSAAVSNSGLNFWHGSLCMHI
jgi:hypothetical protein